MTPTAIAEPIQTELMPADIEITAETRSIIEKLCQIPQQEALPGFPDDFATGESPRLTKVRERDLRVFTLMRDHRLYRYTLMEIGVGRTSAVVEFKDLGLSDEQISVLKKLSPKGASVVMFEELKAAGGTLRKMLNQLKVWHMTYTGVDWVTTDTQLPQVVMGLEEIKAKRDELEQEILQAMPKALKNFLENLAQLVQATNKVLAEKGKSPIDLEKVLHRYQMQFPTEQQIKNWFSFTVQGPDLIPSLTDQANISADLQTAMNRFQASNLEKEKVAAVQRAFEEQQQRIKESIASAAEYAETRMLKTIEQLLQKFDSKEVKVGALNDRTRKSLESNLEDLQAMLQTPFVPTSFEQLVEDAKHISNLAHSGTNKENLQQRIDDLVGKLKRDYEFSYTPAASGHRAGAMAQIRKKAL